VSVVANVAINVDSRGATQKLREVQQAAQQTQKALEGIAGSSAAQPFRAASNSASELIGVLGRLSAAYLGLRTAQQAVQAGIQREESGRRLTFLAKGYGEVARAQELAAQSGRIFGLSATESNKQFAQLYGRLRPLNVSIEDINAAFVGFNTAAKVSGATSAESAGALLQLTQALGSGVLRGQELNSVLEQAPGLVVALTKELGKPVSEIRKLAEQGEITSDVVIRALKRAGTEGADELAAAMNGPAQAVKNLQNEFENFQVAATQDLIPAVVDAMKGLKDLLVSLGPIIRGIGGIAAQTIGTITDLINAATRPGATAAAVSIKGGRLPLAGFGGMSGAGELFKGTSGAFGTGLTGLKAEAAFLAKQRRQPVTDVLLQLMRNRLQRMETPAQVATPDLPSTLLPGLGGSGAGGGKGKGKTDAERAAERLKKEIEQSLELGDRLGVEFSRQVVLLETSSEIERKRLQIQYDFEDRAKQISELKNAEQRINLTTLNEEIKRLDTLKLQSEELKKQIEDYYKLAGLPVGEALRPGAGEFRTDINLGPIDDATKKTEELKKRFKELIDPVNMAMTGAQGIGSAFSTAFQSIVAGAQSARETLASFFKSVGESFVQMATEIIAQMVVMFAFKQLLGLFGGGSNPQMFSGQGPVTMPAAGVGGGASMFGAGAPSFFAEGGFVTSPTNAFIGETGESEYVIPASKMSSAMARYSAGARGESVLSGNAPAQRAPQALDINYNVTDINGMRFVTEEQFTRGMRDAAKMGQAMTFSTLRSSPSVRRKLGV
jgi:tape measure domain-containing protein